eukprot:1128660-Amphidinium_carterae.1
MQAIFTSLEIDTEDAYSLFRLLDTDNNQFGIPRKQEHSPSLAQDKVFNSNCSTKCSAWQQIVAEEVVAWLVKHSKLVMLRMGIVSRLCPEEAFQDGHRKTTMWCQRVIICDVEQDGEENSSLLQRSEWAQSRQFVRVVTEQKW